MKLMSMVKEKQWQLKRVKDRALAALGAVWSMLTARTTTADVFFDVNVAHNREMVEIDIGADDPMFLKFLDALEENGRLWFDPPVPSDGSTATVVSRSEEQPAPVVDSSDYSDDEERVGIAFDGAAGDTVDKRYSLVNKLGRGVYGDVFKAMDVKEKKNVAIKFHKTGLATLHSAAIREVDTLERLRYADPTCSQNIMHVLDIFKVDAHITMVFELADCDLTHRISMERVPLVEIKKLMIDMLKGLIFIHAFGLIHSDLKPDNVLLVNGRAKIADFGVAMWPQDKQRKLVQPPAYRALEVLLGTSAYTTAIDVWSLGCILYDLIHGADGTGGFFGLFHPEDTDALWAEQVHLIEMITHLGPLPDHIHRRLDVPDIAGEVYPKHDAIATFMTGELGYDKGTAANTAHFIRELLHYNPSERLSAKAALLHPWFSYN